MVIITAATNFNFTYEIEKPTNLNRTKNY